ncbi:MAG TPA: Gfo/Idh/MocA family oxidoreductase, partial [Acidobacteriaceae bacterium]
MPITRRDFTRLGAAGVATQFFPGFPRLLHAETAAAADDDKKVGYAIIGLGRIADHFMRGIQETSNSKVTGLVSGHPDKAARIAEKYGVPKESIYNYQNMDAMKDNPAIQAVYVALPNGMHAEYTIRSAKAGKHVLCEKPMSSTVAEAEQMIAACNEAKVKLMIAYRCHYETTNLRAVKLIRDGAIGQIQQINSVFGFRQSLGEWRLDKALAGGGPMMDVGIYCLNATRYLTGEEPAETTAYAYTDKSDPLFQKGVEGNIGWVSKFPSGVVAACNTTYASQMEGYFQVYGSKGWLHV